MRSRLVSSWAAVAAAVILLVAIASGGATVAVSAFEMEHTAPAATMNLPFVDVTKGLKAWYCFKGDTKDCTKKQLAPEAIPQAAGLTAKRKLTASKAAKAKAKAMKGPRLTKDRFGRNNSAYEFNRHRGEYFSIPAGQKGMGKGNFTLPTRTMTLAAWIRLDDRTNRDKQYAILGRNYPTMSWSLSGPSHTQRLDHQRLANLTAYNCTGDAVKHSKEREDDESVNISGKNNKSGDRSNAQTPIKHGKWQHVSMTNDGCAQHWYLNGVLTDITLTKVAWPVDDGLGQWTIGSMGCGAHCSNFHGALDDVRVYDRALTLREIQNVHGACDVCQNGGVCRHKQTTFTCDCKKGFQGDMCQDLTAAAARALAKKNAIVAAKKKAIKDAADKAAKAKADKENLPCKVGDTKCVALKKAKVTAAIKACKGEKTCLTKIATAIKAAKAAAAKVAAAAEKAAITACKGEKVCLAKIAAAKAAAAAALKAKECKKGDAKCLAAKTKCASTDTACIKARRVALAATKPSKAAAAKKKVKKTTTATTAADAKLKAMAATTNPITAPATTTTTTTTTTTPAVAAASTAVAAAVAAAKLF